MVGRGGSWQNLAATLADPLTTSWAWQDPIGDCAFDLRDGVVLQAANGHDLRQVNLSAPRLLQSVPTGDHILQAVSTPVSGEQPAIGGLLLWQDEENYLALERGRFGRSDIIFRGCLAHEECFIGVVV